jgi:uncharacterized protein (TIGR03083 family)
MAEFDFEWYCGQITSAATAMGREPITDPATAVPSCPGWSVADLVRHMGMVHRWVDQMIRTRASEQIDQKSVAVTPPSDTREYEKWLTEGAEQVAGAMRAAGPDTACWTFAPDRRVAWWARRGTHETTVHHADLVLALGGSPSLDPDLSADGIDELLAFLPYGRRTRANMAGLPTGGETLHLHATDSDGEWMIHLTPDGMRWERGHGKGDVAVRGTVGDLLLFAYGRYPDTHSGLEIFGDRELLAVWRAKTTL